MHFITKLSSASARLSFTWGFIIVASSQVWTKPIWPPSQRPESKPREEHSKLSCVRNYIRMSKCDKANMLTYKHHWYCLSTKTQWEKEREKKITLLTQWCQEQTEKEKEGESATHPSPRLRRPWATSKQRSHIAQSDCHVSLELPSAKCGHKSTSC